MSETTVCPNCQAPIKSGLLSSNQLLSKKQTQIINECTGNKSACYCNKCGNALFVNSENHFRKELQEISEHLKQLIHWIPIVTTHSPFNWQYDILGMVTGQTTTGTGVFS